MEEKKTYHCFLEIKEDKVSFYLLYNNDGW